MRATSDGVRHPTIYFVAVSLGAFALYVGASVLPLAGRRLRDATGFDPLSLLGSDSGVGPGKLRKLAFLAGALLLANALLYLAWWRRPGRLLRLIVLLALVPGYFLVGDLLAYVAQRDTVSDRLWRLDIRSVAVPPDFVARTRIDTAGMDDYADVHRAAAERFAALRPEMEALWHEPREATLTGLFLMNVASSMWDYGNKLHPERTGCAASNEDMNFVEVPRAQLTFRQFLDSRIACCVDYAQLLAVLLEQAGIENRLVVVPGHIFNEARLDGEWCVLDPTANLAIHHAWAELLERPPPRIRVTAFPHHNINAAEEDDHRSAAGSLRQLQLYRAAVGGEPYHYVAPRNSRPPGEVAGTETGRR